MSAEVCRLCCKSDTKLLAVFVSSSDEVALATKVLCCFGVKIEEDDSITKKICKSCYFFTNSAYEYRVSAQQNNVKLKKEFAKSEIKLGLCPKIPCPPENISQGDFLNALHLAHKNSLSQKLKTHLRNHSSVQNLKRKYPKVTVPISCHHINVDPIVLLERTENTIHNDRNLGVWSVHRKRHGGETGVVLSRVKGTNNVQNENSTNLGPKKKKRKVLWCETKRKKKSVALRKFTHRNNEASNANEKIGKKKPVSTLRSPITNAAIKLRNRLSRKSKQRTEIRKSARYSDKEIEKAIELSKQMMPIEELVTSIDESVDGPNDSNVLNNLPQSDEYLTHTILNLPNKDNDNDSISNFGEDNNLLVSVGDEKQTFICQTCNQIFDTMLLLKRHKRTAHKVSLQCSKCSKKFAVVESLVRHTLANHSGGKKVQNPNEMKVVLDIPIREEEQLVNSVLAKSGEDQFVNSIEDQSVEPNNTVIKVPESYKRVAKKSTGGILRIRSRDKDEKEENKMDDKIEEYVISSDDESDIIEVNLDQMPTPVTFENVLDTALQAQLVSKPTTSQSEECSAPNDNLLERALTPQLLTNVNASATSETSNDSTSASVECVQETVPESDHHQKEEDQVLVINDSDGDEDVVEFVPNDTDVNSQTDDSTSNTSALQINNNQKQHSIVAPTPEEQQINSTILTNSKITNEDNYINYIFNKCRYGDKAAANQQQWILKDLIKYTENSYISIDISHTSINDVNAFYSSVANTEKVPYIYGYWNYSRAITPKQTVIKSPTANKYFDKQTNYEDRIPILSSIVTSSQVPTNPASDACDIATAQQVGTSQQGIQKTIGFQNVIPQRNSQRTYQGKYLDSLSENMVIPKPNNIQRTSNHTSLEQISTSPRNEQKTVGQQYARTNYRNKIAILNSKMIVSKTNTNQGNTNQPVGTSTAGSARQISTSSQITQKIIDPQNVIQQQNNPRTNYRNTVPILSNNTNVSKYTANRQAFNEIATSGIGSKKQVSTSPQVLEQNSQRTNYRSKVPVFLNSAIVTNHNPNQEITDQIMQTNVEQQDTVQQTSSQSEANSVLKSYLSNETCAMPQPATSISANNPEQINLFYIMSNNTSGQPDTLAQSNIPDDLIQLTGAQPDPVVLKGISYSNFAQLNYGNIANSGQPVLVQQFVGQPTNVNIQNYVSINQSNINTSSTDIQEQVIQSPICVTPSSLDSNVNIVGSPVYVAPMQQNQSALSVEEPSSKPSIRIKTLSELTGKTMLNTEERNLMHGFYSNTVQTFANKTSTKNDGLKLPHTYLQNL